MLDLSSIQLTRTVKSIMVACGFVFVLQLLMPRMVEQHFSLLLGLSVEGIMHGWLWQFFTYAFLHGNLLHILLNMLGLLFMGPELERQLGTRMFALLFFFSSVLGGIGWLAMTWPHAGICVGASGGLFGLIGAYAGLFPHRRITLLVFFVLPVTMPAWLMGVLFGLFQLAYLLNPGGSSIAYAAHLAGGIAGFLFVRIMYRRRDDWFARMGSHRPSYHPRSIDDGPTQQQIDLILDKIARDGIHTLSPRERELLQKAGRRQ